MRLTSLTPPRYGVRRRLGSLDFLRTGRPLLAVLRHLKIDDLAVLPWRDGEPAFRVLRAHKLEVVLGKPFGGVEARCAVGLPGQG